MTFVLDTSYLLSSIQSENALKNHRSIAGIMVPAHRLLVDSPVLVEILLREKRRTKGEGIEHVSHFFHTIDTTDSNTSHHSIEEKRPSGYVQHNDNPVRAHPNQFGGSDV
ncbi:unnamed protein product [Albugo candida]|uniref:PIN domain-containing protein n=1 Tax=Albugo candida TaxID=65357 RepID=A0A024GAJ2_9STRA|nr:unnamed protein product [Albugo candida]|eukprot:CCI43689.1 unnamed protein product [Albugo candida]